MPVALAIVATDRSISAHRMTKVSPTAMTPVTETWVRILAALSSDTKERLATLKNTSRTIRVTNGAMMRNWLRMKAMAAVISGRLQQPVLAHGFACELAHDAPLPHDHDAIGQRQHALGLGRQHDDAQVLLAQTFDDSHHIFLRADVHAARRLAQHQDLGWRCQPLGQRHLLLIAARQAAERCRNRPRPDRQRLNMAPRDLLF